MFGRKTSSSDSGSAPKPGAGQIAGETASPEQCARDYQSSATTRADFTKLAKRDGWGKK